MPNAQAGNGREQSSTPPIDLTGPHDGLIAALGEIVATERREWQRERSIAAAELGRLVAEAGRTVAELRAELVELRADFNARVTARLGELTSGRDGAPGAPGERGPQGERGEQGPAGQDAREWLACGLFDPAGSYHRGNIAELDGNSFVALLDDPGVCPGDGWRLLSKRGKPGPRGDRGERGPSGPSGATVIGWNVDAGTFRAWPVMSDGSECAPIELRALFEAYHASANNA